MNEKEEIIKKKEKELKLKFEEIKKEKQEFLIMKKKEAKERYETQQKEEALRSKQLFLRKSKKQQRINNKKGDDYDSDGKDDDKVLGYDNDGGKITLTLWGLDKISKINNLHYYQIIKTKIF